MLPITDPQAKAIEQTAKATQQAIRVLEGLGGYLKEVFGTVPADLVGYFGGDWLKVRRAENLLEIVQRAKKLLSDRGIADAEPASMSITLPIMIAAADESRDELRGIWAALLAAAADPARSKKFRIQFIEIAKSMDPLDAIVLQAIRQMPRAGDITQRIEQKRKLASKLGLSGDEFQVSVENLVRLALITESPVSGGFSLTSLGREFLRSIED